MLLYMNCMSFGLCGLYMCAEGMRVGWHKEHKLKNVCLVFNKISSLILQAEDIIRKYGNKY